LADDRYGDGFVTGALIVGLIGAPVVAWLISRVERNEQRISRNEQRISSMEKYYDDKISEFQQTQYESDLKSDTAYRFLWNEIKKVKSLVLTPDEKNRLLSYLDKAYREKLDVSNRF